MERTTEIDVQGLLAHIERLEAQLAVAREALEKIRSYTPASEPTGFTYGGGKDIAWRMLAGRGNRAAQALADLPEAASELLRDRKRLDWLEERCKNPAHRFLFMQCISTPDNKAVGRVTMRAALDAAIAAKEDEGETKMLKEATRLRQENEALRDALGKILRTPYGAYSDDLWGAWRDIQTIAEQALAAEKTGEPSEKSNAKILGT